MAVILISCKVSYNLYAVRDKIITKYQYDCAIVIFLLLLVCFKEFVYIHYEIATF